MSEKKLDGNELRRLNGYQCRDELKHVENLPTESLAKFNANGCKLGVLGGSYYEPTHEEAEEIRNHIYRDGGIADQLRQAREKATREDKIERYEMRVDSIDNGVLRGKRPARY